MSISSQIRIGIDVGGTFTDFVYLNPVSGQISTLKLLSTPGNPARALLEGLSIILNLISSADLSAFGKIDIVHGSTVATNALIERKGAITALITTAGFKDVLQIGRQNRPALYDLSADPPAPLIPSERRFEVKERVDHTGSILEPIVLADIQEIIKEIETASCESVAVCLLFSFLNDHHERILAHELRSSGIFTSVSSEILPEFREYERTSTTAVNAYVSPVLQKYLEEISEKLSTDDELRAASLRVMQSNGGTIGIDEAGKFGARCILSGPAGGVIAAEYLGRQIPEEALGEQTSGLFPRFITFDMGGTSTDVSLILGFPTITTENSIAGNAIHIPMLDIHTIGAGGGSIAWVDRGGALRVGPESAGAAPGPACYGLAPDGQLRATVTDANLFLGRILPEYFLGGKMELYPQRSRDAIEQLAQILHLEPVAAALGVIEVVNTHMERALRVISVERGHDPRDFSLASFGGAGGLHAAGLARKLGIPRVIIPPTAATFSAFGLLVADVVKDYSRTVMLPGTTPSTEIENLLEQLTWMGREEIRLEGVPEDSILVEKMIDLRYQGQSYELTIPYNPQFAEDFRRKHGEVYGYMLPAGTATEIVNIRVRATGQLEIPSVQPEPLGKEDPSPAMFTQSSVYFNTTPELVPCYLADQLQPGNRLSGPTLIVRNDTVILLTGKDSALVDEFRNIHLTIGG